MELREPQGLEGSMTPPPEKAEPKVKKSKKRSRADTGVLDPSSSIAIYSNMLIAEQALRKQYMDMQWMRKKYGTFFWIVTLLTLYSTWSTLTAPSIYGWIRLLQRLLTFTGYTVLGMFALTGLYTQVFFVAPRFLSDANKGLRPLNVRVVRQRAIIKERLYRLFNPSYMAQPGGLIKIVPSPTTFSAHFIETWELYRQEYWERHERRKVEKAARPSSS